MNIREAKEEIKRTAVIYLDKNESGEYTIPYKRQRPVFMTGVPGIGKTAIVEQIAAEMDLALVSCSMAHHTRQSAQGLPYIAKKEYDGRVWQVSEYAMSEIMAEVYEMMKETGRKEGLLFLDEINHVSETLMPTVLMLLQHKMLGNKRLPEGWIIIAAGSFPGYGKAVRTFDITALDRLKCLQIEENFGVWKLYAYEQGIHAAVLSFLEMNKDCFYSVRTSADAQEYATARGWEDLSRAIRLYEKKDFRVDRKLILQYVADEEIALKFSEYYDSFLKVRTEYRVEDILKGKTAAKLTVKGEKAGTDERISVLYLLLDSLNRMIIQVMEQERVLQRVQYLLRIAKKQTEEEEIFLPAMLYLLCGQLQEERKMRQRANSLSLSGKEEYHRIEQLLEHLTETAGKEREYGKQFPAAEKEFDAIVRKHDEQAAAFREALEHVNRFIQQAWGQGQETEIFHDLIRNGRIPAERGFLSWNANYIQTL